MPSLTYTPPGESSARSFELHKRITSIGSGPDNDLVVADPDMEQTHALVRFDGRTFNLQTLGTGELIVNGKKRKSHALEHGDDLLLGGTVLRFQLYSADEPAAAPDAENDIARTYRQMLLLSEKLMGDHDVPVLLEDLMDAIISLTEADKGFLILRDEEEALHVRVARNLQATDIDQDLQQFSDSIVNAVIQERKPLIVADALNHDAFASSRSVVNLKVCSVMCVPMLVGDELLGLIYVGNDNVVNLFNEQNLETLTIFAAQASLIIAKALALDELRIDNQKLRDRIEDMRFGQIIGACDAMRGLFKRIKKVAGTDVSVLITGETGTGKELIAKELHARSNRAKGPFVTINCGAIPENLLESELFGHVRGAFTGATSSRAGKFQAADGGTLFLDEIGEMPLNLQVKILRALQERTVTRVGETRPERVDIRVVAATHRDLEEMIGDGTFREDLYYRLNVVRLDLPPLRERGDDIVLIGRYFLEKFVGEFDVGKKSFAKKTHIAMKKHNWPGNIRQLENAIKKAVILSETSTIRPSDLDLREENTRTIIPLADARDQWQRQYILEALELNDGNRTKTARDLGVDPRTVFRFLEKEAERGQDEDVEA